MDKTVALRLVSNLLVGALQISNKIRAAEAEGRETLDADEVAEIAAIDDAARAGLVEAIEESLT